MHLRKVLKNVQWWLLLKNSFHWLGFQSTEDERQCFGVWFQRISKWTLLYLEPQILLSELNTSGIPCRAFFRLLPTTQILTQSVHLFFRRSSMTSCVSLCKHNLMCVGTCQQNTTRPRNTVMLKETINIDVEHCSQTNAVFGNEIIFSIDSYSRSGKQSAKLKKLAKWPIKKLSCSQG